MSLNSRFLKNPAEFAQRFALNPQGNRTSQNPGTVGFLGTDLKTKHLMGGGNFLQVQGANRILYCNILQGGVATDEAALRIDTRADGNVCRMEFSPSAQSGSAFPVFWLPWLADNAVRITLKTSKHETRTQGIFFKSAVEPRIFVTAALSGCSIFVEGDRDQPTVYHLNAASTSPGAMDPNDPTMATRANNKMLTMEQFYQQISTSAHAKLPATQQGTKSADMSMYMGAQFNPLAVNARRDLARQQLPLNRTLAPVVGVHNTKHVGDVGTMMTFGTVFGHKGGDGLWTFYYQSRTRADYWEKADPSLPDDNYANWRHKVRWVALSCREFWPNGARQIQR